MQMSSRSLHRQIMGNIKETFLPKSGMQKKQVSQDPGYIKDVKVACCMLSAKYSNNTVDWFQFV